MNESVKNKNCMSLSSYIEIITVVRIWRLCSLKKIKLFVDKRNYCFFNSPYTLFLSFWTSRWNDILLKSFQEKKVKKKKNRALLFEETKKKNEFLRFVILLSNTLLYLRHFTMKRKKSNTKSLLSRHLL